MDLSVIESFTKQKNIAVVGVSSKGKGFGASVFKHLKDNNYNAFAVNKNGGTLNDIKLYNSHSSIEHTIDGVITVVPPFETENIVKEAKELGIKFIWMQQGSESNNAINYCKENGMLVVSGECILMFVEPVKSIHKFHRWIDKVTGKVTGKFPQAEKAN